MRRKVTAKQRHRVAQRTVKAYREAAIYGRRLAKERTREIKRVLSLCKSKPIGSYVAVFQQELTEEGYLTALLSNMSVSIGLNSARESLVNIGLSEIKASGATWEDEVYAWVRANIGVKITLIEETFRGEVIKWVQDAIISLEGLSIEASTKLIYKEVLYKWMGVSKWQVRRIMQTEALIASSVGQYASLDALGINYEKQWTATFNNTRPDHALMDGVIVGKGEFFNMPNGDIMLYPHDTSNGAQAENIINCTCGTIDTPI